MINKIFILHNKKIEGIETRKLSLEKMLKSCGKEVQSSSKNVDLIITMGGDGTLLKGVHLLENNKTLIYGIKYGKVGFLTNSPQDSETKIRKILRGNYVVTERMLLGVTVVRNGRIVLKDFCLNEAFINKHGIRIMDINVAGRRETIFKTRGDGLIVATPTGSTAHSFSAMGPVLDPEMKCFLIIPVCPHTLSWRPVILRDSEIISIEILQDALLVIDGQNEFSLENRDTVVVRKSARTAKTIMDEKFLFRNLQSKFNWSV
ncbi:MAG TPA: NAD(+)/NADH kinase [bacterium]|nr:NAD(+)/NADH kinase [bacterium]